MHQTIHNQHCDSQMYLADKYTIFKNLLCFFLKIVTGVKRNTYEYINLNLTVIKKYYFGFIPCIDKMYEFERTTEINVASVLSVCG